MKTTLLFLLAILIGFACEAADAPRYQNSVIFFDGKLDSGRSCSATSLHPEGQTRGNVGKMTFNNPGKVSEVEWSFVERRGDKDVYQFFLRSASDSPESTTISKSVEFGGQRVIVFEDKFQAVVIEPPKVKP